MQEYASSAQASVAQVGLSKEHQSNQLYSTCFAFFLATVAYTIATHSTIILLLPF
eukprot:COSAG02_NODE_4601_length_5177_cov_7.402718_2_plen_55_part_00